MEGPNRSWITAGAAAVIVLAVLAEALRRRRRSLDERDLFTEEPVPPVPLPSERSGSRQDRGRSSTYALDVERLRSAAGFEPVVEYLTYVQSKRGDTSHILFVRQDDLDTLARREGQQVSTFLERLEQLGVVVSNN